MTQTEADAPAPEAAFTVEELALEAGVNTSTIRYYQHKKVLDPPERKGRVGIYRQSHVERLGLIADLRDKGLALDAIAGAVKRMEGGDDSLAAWLGVSERLQTPWTDEAPRLVDEAELGDLLGGRRAGFVAALEESGVLERRDGGLRPTWILTSPGLLAIALGLDDAGVDVDVATSAALILRRHLGLAADELIATMSPQAGRGMGVSTRPEDLARAMDALRPLGLEAARLVFAQEMERALVALIQAGPAAAPRASGKSTRRR